ncbi:hypothetical protein VCUG_02681, partial [Vavraia culicis subsp. floridensis]
MPSFPPFINHLFTILETPINHPYIRWSSTGKSIVIPNQHMFTVHVLVKYFNHGNFSSFIRQLNKYGFSKVRNSLSGVHEFRQEHFIKEKPFLSRWIRRRKGSGVKKRVEELWMKYNCLSKEISEIKRKIGISTDEYGIGRNDDVNNNGSERNRNKKISDVKENMMGGNTVYEPMSRFDMANNEDVDDKIMINCEKVCDMEWDGKEM